MLVTVYREALMKILKIDAFLLTKACFECYSTAIELKKVLDYKLQKNDGAV